MILLKRFVAFLLFIPLWNPSASAQSLSKDEVRISNAHYEVWFDHRDYYENHDIEKTRPRSFHFLDKRTKKVRRLPFGDEQFGGSIERLFLCSKYLSVYQEMAFADRETGFFSRYDLEKGEELGDLQSNEIQPSAASFSPDGKYFVFVDFPGVGMELGYRLTHKLELISMDGQGWKHLFLNGEKHEADWKARTGRELPRPLGRKPENYYVISNLLWTKDSKKVIFIAGQDLYFEKEPRNDEDLAPRIPYYGLVVLDLSKGLENFQFRSSPLDEIKFNVSKDPGGALGALRAQVKLENGKILTKLVVTRTVNGKELSQQTSWREQSLP